MLCAVLLTSCTEASQETERPEAQPSVTAGVLTQEQREHAQIYAAVIERLVTRDHTFGRGDSPFDRVFVIDGVIPGAGDPMTDTLVVAPERFDRAMREAILDHLDGLPPLEFVRDPDSVRKGRDGMGGVKNDGVIISLGPIERAADELHVGNGLWCGGLCGQWLTYVVEQTPDGWTITGTTGPAAIS